MKDFQGLPFPGLARTIHAKLLILSRKYMLHHETVLLAARTNVSTTTLQRRLSNDKQYNCNKYGFRATTRLKNEQRKQYPHGGQPVSADSCPK
eukprot:193506-Amphidinium_carterae.1